MAAHDQSTFGGVGYTFACTGYVASIQQKILVSTIQTQDNKQ
jgi:hypothetical protein